MAPRCPENLRTRALHYHQFSVIHLFRTSASCNRNFKCSQYRALTVKMTSKQTRPALFWDIKRPKFVVGYRRFGKTYWSNIQGSQAVREDNWVQVDAV